MGKTFKVGEKVKLRLGGEASSGGLSGRIGTVVSKVGGMYRVITCDRYWHVDGYFSASDMQKVEDGNNKI